MQIQDVENLSADELKAQRVEAVQVARKAPDVAERFVGARIDAKVRDEKLASQGETIGNLTAQAVERTKVINTLQEELQRAQQRVTALEADVDLLTTDLTSERTRANRLKIQADRYTAVVMQCASALNTAIGLQQTEVVSNGG